MVCRLVGAVLLGLCSLMPLARAEEIPQVSPQDYRAFWVWPGVHPPAEVKQAAEIFLLFGEVRSTPTGGSAAITRLMPRVPRYPQAGGLWLVLRVETLEWQSSVIPDLLLALRHWKGAGNRVLGVQIDFDAKTQALGLYARRLGHLRERVPAEFKLGVTGLMDWSAQGKAVDLMALGSVVDEVVIQTYQGRRMIPSVRDYLPHLNRLPMPFRIGLVQGSRWKPPPGVEDLPQFGGYVVFLLNPPATRR